MSSSNIGNFKVRQPQTTPQDPTDLGNGFRVEKSLSPIEPGNDAGTSVSAKQFKSSQKPRLELRDTIGLPVENQVIDGKTLMAEAQMARDEAARAKAEAQFIYAGVIAIQKQRRDEELLIDTVAEKMRRGFVTNAYYREKEISARQLVRMSAMLQLETSKRSRSIAESASTPSGLDKFVADGLADLNNQRSRETAQLEQIAEKMGITEFDGEHYTARNRPKQPAGAKLNERAPK